MVVFLFLAILPFLLFFMYHKSKECNTQHPSCLSLFRTRNLPKSYSLVNLNRLDEEAHFPYMSQMVASSPSSTIVFHIPFGGGTYIMTANPSNVRHILKTQHSTYQKGQINMSLFGELFGRGIINVDGDEWKYLRQIASHEFTKGSVRSALETVMEPSISNCLIPTLSIAAKNGQVLDLEDVFQRFSLDTTCKNYFGYDPDSLSRSVSGSDIMEAFREAFLIVSRRSKSVFPGVKLWEIERFFNVGSHKKLMKLVCKIREFALAIIEQKKWKLKLGLEADDLLARLLLNYNGHGDDNNMVTDFITNTILAGHDTIPSALTWFFWVVATNPKVEGEILSEIKRVEESNQGSIYDQVKDMVYTHAALCESMRLYPPAPEELKEVAEDDVLPDGTPVKKGMRLVISIYAMGRSERIWGEDYAEFKPERWLEREESSKTWRFIPRDQYEYPVFNAGPRVCLGKEFAFLQMKTLVVHFLKKFKMVPRNVSIKGFEPRFVSDLTSKMKGGFPVMLEERKRTESVISK